MSVNTAMTALANSIRRIDNSTASLTIEDMTNKMNAECDLFDSNIAAQIDLLTQIDAALTEKGI